MTDLEWKQESKGATLTLAKGLEEEPSLKAFWKHQ